MILLRVFAFVIGSLLVLLAPQYSVDLLSELKGQYVEVNLRTVAIGMGAVALSVSGYFLLGLFGHLTVYKLWLRLTGGALLLLAFVASGAALLFSESIAVITVSGLLICFTCVLFGAFIFPGMKKSSRRPMRPRDYGNDDDPADLASRQQ